MLLKCILTVFLVLSANLAWAQAPLAQLFVTGNSLGKFRACPTCGQYAEGGLDRRFTVFEQHRGEPNGLFVSLGYDLGSYVKSEQPETAAAKPMVEAYNLLDYDLGVLTPLDVDYLKRAGATAPEGFVPQGGASEIRIVERSGVRLGFVIFPAAKEPYAGPSEDEMRDAAQAAERVADQVDLVVGLSSWGERGELAFMKNHPEAVDMLLGSGPATGVGARPSPDGRTLWGRSSFEGRSVVRVEVLERPAPGQQWAEGRSFRSEVLPLDISIRGEGKISALFAWM